MPSTNIDTAHHHALLLRTISGELTGGIAPLLASTHAVEKLRFAGMALDYLSADLSVAAELLPQMRAHYRGAIAEALAGPGGAALGEARAGYQAELAAIPEEQGLAAQREVAALRDLAGRIVRAFADAATPEADAAAALLGKADFDWLERYEQLRNAPRGAAAEAGAAPAATEKPVTEAAMTAWLRKRLPNSPDLTVTKASVVPGGRSKRTIALTVEGTEELPAELIMRQDMNLKYAGPTVKDEVGPLARLAGLGVVAPRPLVVEPEESEFGRAFFICERFEGAPPGEYFGLWTKCPNAMRDLARALGRLHSIPPQELGFDPTGADPAALFRDRLEYYWNSWRSNATRGSALVDYAFAWAREKARKPYRGAICVIHGDIGAHNLLVHDDRLTAILDWEFSRVGGPAEDLGVARPNVVACMDWDEFMAIYRDAGGLEVPEERIAMGELLNWLMGCHLVATSGRNFVEGGTTDFMKGANSFAGLRGIELKIANVMRGVMGR